MEKQQMTLAFARAILLSRALLSVGTIKNVGVTNVLFTDKEGNPFTDERWQDGEPYAIAIFNACNQYGKNLSRDLFIQAKLTNDVEEREELLVKACNQNLSARVSIKEGVKLQEAMLATVMGAKRVGEDENGDTYTTVSIKKVFPNTPVDASQAKAHSISDEVFNLDGEIQDVSEQVIEEELVM